MTDDTYLTTEEVLEYLQVNLRTVYRLIKAGRIPAVRVGRQWRFRKGDLDAWLDSQRRGGRAAAPAAAQPTESTGHRVLVVDDEESIRELLTRALELAEYDVEAVADARSALERLRLGAYDLLVADLRMPGMDGLALIREARRLHPTLRVIIITGYSTEASAIEAVNLGVVGYLVKPFRVPQVLGAVARALGEHLTARRAGNPSEPYSARRAVIGFTCAARSAGTRPPTIATPSSAIAVPPKATGLVGDVSNSSAVTSRARPSAETTPTATPVRARRSVPPSTSRATSRAVAPSAMRTPISGVRWVTL